MHQVKNVLGVLEMSLKAALYVSHLRVLEDVISRQLYIVFHVLFNMDELAFNVCE